MHFTKFSVASLAFAGLLSAGSISLSPGSIVVEQSASPFTSSNIETYASTALSSTGQITGANQIVNGMAVINGTLFLGDGAGYVDRVNLSSGSVASSFFTGSTLLGLGSINGNLLTFANNYYGTGFKIYSTAGALLQTISLSTVPSSTLGPVTSDGTSLYLADEYTGIVYQYSLTGALLGSFDTHTGSGFFGAALSGLAYDPSNNSLWISDNKTNQLLDLSTGGTLLSQTSTGSFTPANLAVVFANASANVPEPGYSALLLTALASVMAFRNRVRR